MKQSRQVIGWKVKPRSWYPELPGKAASVLTSEHQITEWHKEQEAATTMARKRATGHPQRVVVQNRYIDTPEPLTLD